MTHHPHSGADAAQREDGAYMRSGTMDSDCARSQAKIDINRLVKSLVAYRKPSASRGWYELAVTFVPFVVLMACMMWGVAAGDYAALVFTPLAGLLLLRMFIIQHDCGHGAFMPRKRDNDRIGRVIGVLTLTPYDCWKRSHELHHAVAQCTML